MLKFGNSIWRDIIENCFTCVRIVLQIISNYLKIVKKENGDIIIEYDTRFMSYDFKKYSVKILAGNGFKIYFSKEDVPTPVITYELLELEL